MVSQRRNRLPWDLVRPGKDAGGAAQSVLHCPRLGSPRGPLTLPNLKSTLNKTPNYKQQKKRREEMQKKRNEEKQRQQSERKVSDSDFLPPKA